MARETGSSLAHPGEEGYDAWPKDAWLHSGSANNWTGMALEGTENYGGPIVTVGGIVFIGATIFDRKMHAFDSRTGRLLWESTLPFAGHATPATYMIDGRQYVAIAAGADAIRNGRRAESTSCLRFRHPIPGQRRM
jgi:glucose dehydrogenase